MACNYRILIAEDDLFLADGLKLFLSASGFNVEHKDNGIDADAVLSAAHFDLLVLDIGLPQMDGLQVLTNLRERGNNMPVIILTARDAVDDRVLGLDSGANDYVMKPFDMFELEARIKVHLRPATNQEQIIQIGNLTFDRQSRTVRINGNLTSLTPRELAVLELLLGARGPVTKERLVMQLSAWDMDVSANAVDIAIHRLRKKLEGCGFEIHTSRGVGYIIV